MTFTLSKNETGAESSVLNFTDTGSDSVPLRLQKVTDAGTSCFASLKPINKSESVITLAVRKISSPLKSLYLTFRLVISLSEGIWNRITAPPAIGSKLNASVPTGG